MWLKSIKIGAGCQRGWRSEMERTQKGFKAIEVVPVMRVKKEE
jgi:hypothetical protein